MGEIPLYSNIRTANFKAATLTVLHTVGRRALSRKLGVGPLWPTVVDAVGITRLISAHCPNERLRRILFFILPDYSLSRSWTALAPRFRVSSHEERRCCNLGPPQSRTLPRVLQYTKTHVNEPRTRAHRAGSSGEETRQCSGPSASASWRLPFQRSCLNHKP